MPAYIEGFQLVKMNPFHYGTTIRLAKTSTSTCPVMAMAKYLETSQDSPRNLPLFQFSSGKYLTRESFTQIIRSLLASKYYASHSFRIGAATVAAAAGIPAWLFKPWSLVQQVLSYLHPYSSIYNPASSITHCLLSTHSLTFHGIAICLF